MTIQRKQAADI